MNVTIISTSLFPTVLYFSDLSRQAGPSNLALSWIMLLWLFPVWDLVAMRDGNLTGRIYKAVSSFWVESRSFLVLPGHLVRRHINRAGRAGFESVYTTQMRLGSRLITEPLTNSEFLLSLNASVMFVRNSTANWDQNDNFTISFHCCSIAVRILPAAETVLTLELRKRCNISASAVFVPLLYSSEAWRTSLHRFWSLRAKQQQEAGMEAERATIHCKLCLTDCPKLETSTLQSCNCVFCVQVRIYLSLALRLKWTVM